MTTKTVTLLLLRGLPGSGKSTFAQKVIEESKALGRDVTDGKWKRINKDTMRMMLDLDEWSGRNEFLLNQVVESMIRKYLKAGFNVVSDNMNLAAEHINKAVEIVNEQNKLAEQAEIWNGAPVPYARVEIKDFDTPLEVCIERDSKRPKPVTEREIRFIHEKYLRNGFPDLSLQLSKLTRKVS